MSCYATPRPNSLGSAQQEASGLFQELKAQGIPRLYCEPLSIDDRDQVA
jgi:hypothetical protein